MELNEESLKFLNKLLSVEKIHQAADFNILDCRQFWHSEHVVDWFKGKGYITYRQDSPRAFCDSPRLPFQDYCECDYPFAYHQADNGLAAKDTTGKIIFAQDSQARHVAIKLTRVGSDEYRIMRFLYEQGLEVMQRHCILPILDLLHCNDACFAVMPRWGSAIYLPNTNTLGGILIIIESMLKALAFLHSHNIVHRDIHMDNMVVNFFGSDMLVGGYYSLRRSHLARGLFSYALIDFDLSIMLPLDVQPGNFKMSRKKSWVGTYRPSDTFQGEFDYDPFAYDVGTLGVVLCKMYQKYTPEVPMLAPFLDRMVTRDIKKRFTAAQALEFLNSVVANATKAQLSIQEDENFYARKTKHYEVHDRWEELPKDFQEKWSTYREPIGIPLSWKLLRTLRDMRWFPEPLIPAIRRFAFKTKNRLKRS